MTHPVNPEPTNHLYNYVLSQQPETVQTYWKQVIEQRGGPVKFFKENNSLTMFKIFKNIYI